VVFVIDPTDATQLVCGIFIVQVANQRVAGIGGHSQNAALVEQLHRLLEQTGVRVFWVDNEKLGHLEICWMK
jgi:L-fucose isomerase-like protein